MKKREKIKINTRKFNEIIEKQLDDGEVVDIDISFYKNKMEVCDGGEVSSKSTGYGQIDLNNLLKYKQSGGKRTTPQDKSEQIKSAVEKKD